MISYDAESRNKNKYLAIVKYLIRFKYYKKICKKLLDNINDILSSDTENDITKITALNNEFKLNILLMVSYYKKIKTLYSTLN